MNKRRILIIGASSTLGFASAKLLAREKMDLWLTYKSNDKEAFLRNECPGSQLTRLDVMDQDQIGQLQSAIENSWGTLDGLLVASGMGLLQPAVNWKRFPHPEIFEINIRSLLDISQAFFRPLTLGRCPSVLFLSSITALAGTAGVTAYAATKGAVASLTRSLAIEWAPRGIRVNALAPGIIPSPLVEQMFTSLSDTQRQAIRDRHPLGFGEPDDVAHAAKFLLSPEAKWITGTVLPVDGGYTAQ